jgi:hypothetical protein
MYIVFHQGGMPIPVDYELPKSLQKLGRPSSGESQKWREKKTDFTIKNKDTTG